jgi:hypothetical protein
MLATPAIGWLNCREYWMNAAPHPATAIRWPPAAPGHLIST